MSNKKTLVVSIAHSYDLIFFLRLVRESTIKQDYLLKVIFQEHNYFIGKMEIATGILKEISDDIIFINNVEIPNYGRNIVKNLLLAYKFRKKIKNNFSNGDTLLILDKSTYKANQLLSYFKSSILFQFPNEATNSEKYILYFQKHFLINLYHMIFNMHPIKVKKLKNSEKLIEEYFINLPSAKKIYISNIQNHDSINFSSVVNHMSSNKIAIFGSRYLGWNLTKETVKKIHTFYRNIYNEFKNDATYLYVSHPLEKGLEFEEISSIFENNIKNETSYLNSEHFLLENLDVSHCFSIGSTSSKSAYQMGFNSKVAYKSLLSETNIIYAFDRVFEDIPSHVHIAHNNIDDIIKSTNTMPIEANLNKLYEVIQ